MSAAMLMTAAFGLAACKPEGEGGNGGGSGSITVHYMSGGFGKSAYERLAADYKALTGVTVKYVPSRQAGEIQNLLKSNQEKNDIVMPLLNMYDSQDAKKLEDLSDVYEAIPDGETLPLKDKINSTLYDYAEAKDGKRYQMFSNNSVSAFCYNIDTLDEIFGEGNWSLPKTTNQLKETAEEIKSRNYYAFSAATGINYNWDYVGTVWWAQYEGLEAFQKYFYAQYWDSSEEAWKLGKEINDAAGRRYALETLGELMNSQNGYMHKHAGRMDFKSAQSAFLSNGYRDDVKKVAFMVNGDWLENEMSSDLLLNPQRIGMMRNPVISELAGKLVTVGTESKLVEIVTAVDEGKTSVAGVSEADFAMVKQARLMGYTATPNYPIGIPSYRPESKKKLAKDYLVYLFSDRAQKIIASELQGLTYATNYVPDESVNVSDFVRSRINAFGNDFVPVFPVNASPVAYRGGLGDLPGVKGIDKSLYDGASATSLLNTCATEINAQWSVYMKALETSV